MKIGKARLKRILSKETGIPVRTIGIYGKYEDLGSKERLVIGGHTIVAQLGGIYICAPVLKGDEIVYRTRKINEERPCEPASSGALEINQLNHNIRRKECT